MRDVLSKIRDMPRWESFYEGFRGWERFLGVDLDVVPEGAVCVGYVGAPEVLKPDEHLVFHFERVAARGDFFEGDVVIAFFRDHYSDVEPVFRVVLQTPEPCHGRDWFYGVQAVVHGENVSRLHDVRSDGAFHDFLRWHGEPRAAEVFQHLWRLKPSLFIFGQNERVVGRIYA